MSRTSIITALDKVCSKEPEEVLLELNSRKENGLSNNEVAERLEQFGPSKLREYKSKNIWKILFDQVRSLIRPSPKLNLTELLLIL